MPLPEALKSFLRALIFQQLGNGALFFPKNGEPERSQRHTVSGAPQRAASVVAAVL